MNFDWDPAGRLWVAETPEYPNGRRGMRPDYRGKEWKDHGGIDPTPGEQDRKGLDKISILTDTDGDGVMDKKEIFYEGLELVTGLVFYKDGVIVTQAPDILWLRDTDGDGKADKVEKLYTGLGTKDTHAVINNPRWGWDGWIYATHGYSSSSEVKNAKGETQGTIGSGVVRFRPDGSKIEQYSSKGGNTWGLEITGDNRVMWTQPTSGTILNQTLLPEYALARGKIGNTASFNNVIASPKTFPAMSWDQQAYRQIDHVGDFTAAAGCVIYDGGSWPAEYNGDYFTTEPTINIVHHSRLKPAGSSYTGYKLPGREETEFIRSKDMWWRPIEVRVGPDGAVYVGDFYNQAVIHNDTRGPDHNKVNAAVRPDRDHYFGRIWRIDHKDAKQIAVPDLSKASEKELVTALEHPNRAVRMTASRLIFERISSRDGHATAELVAPLMKHPAAETRIAALWTTVLAEDLSPKIIAAAKQDQDDAVRWNAMLAAEFQLLRRAPTPVALKEEALRREKPLGPGASLDPIEDIESSLLDGLFDGDPRVRVAALRGLAALEPNDLIARNLSNTWSLLDDEFQRSAAIGAGSRIAIAVISAALDDAVKSQQQINAGTPDTSSRASLIAALTDKITAPEDAAKLVITIADKPARIDLLKSTILGGLARTLKDAPTMTPELSAALGKILASPASSNALPLTAKWDKSGALKAEVGKQFTGLVATAHDAKASDEARLAAARTLLGLSSVIPDATKGVTELLGGSTSAGFQKNLVVALGETDSAAIGTALTNAWNHLPAEAQAAAFDVVLKRADWANAFLDAVKAKEVDPSTLGPASAARLRTHPDRAIAKRATEMLDALNPMAKAKKEVIAKLYPIVEQKGDPAKGKALFTTTCAICHKFDGVGAEIGPVLTGMGTHGAGELLTAIADPNAEVEPSFTTWNIESKDGQFYSGIIVAENPASLTLKSLAGIQEVKTAAIKSRVNTGRSLMPEGFDGLGGEALRDIIAYMQSVDGGKFRTVDLRDAFTASTSVGLYASQATKGDSFIFTKTGTVNVGGIPFNIVSPEKAATGSNIIVLKGGPSKAIAKTMPQQVEAKLGGFKANRLHFLGGVTGWGFQNNGDTSDVLKITIHTTQGQRETLVCKNGVEFADYFRPVDVPGSKYAEGVVKNHQMRWFSKALSGPVEIDHITLESFDTGAAPTIVAITAELADANAPLPATVTAATEPTKPGPNSGVLTIAAKVDDDAGFKPQFDDAVPQPPATRPANGPRVLLVGGGSSHDFVKFFGDSDKKLLAPNVGWVDFTQNANGVPAILDRVDVLVWSANQPLSTATRKALIDFANSGKGIIALHPGTWYAWKNFPEWNLQVVGGGTRGHDKLGAFSVKVTNPAHPITKGVTANFEITDELYNYIADPAGSPIEVLAEATSPTTSKTFPQVWVVKHPKSRIVGLTLGHDARAHDLPEYQTLLKNAVSWAAGK
jgi:putative membrane-bound dehydrogenase-like protein